MTPIEALVKLSDLQKQLKIEVGVNNGKNKRTTNLFG